MEKEWWREKGGGIEYKIYGSNIPWKIKRALNYHKFVNWTTNLSGNFFKDQIANEQCTQGSIMLITQFWNVTVSL